MKCTAIHLLRIVLVGAVSVNFFSMLATPAGASEQRYSQTSLEKTSAIRDLKARARSGSRVKVIVGLNEDFVPVGRLRSAQRGQQREKIGRAQQRFTSRLPRGRFAERRRFRNIPFVAIEIDEAQLDMLSSMPEISSIEADLLSRPSLASSGALIGANAAWSDGYDGQGFAIAVLDTGVDTSHPYFSNTGKLIAEGCFSTNSPDEGGSSTCPGGVEVSTAAGSGGICNTSFCDHGTHVAGIAVGNDLEGPNFGIARGAELVSIQVYTEFENPAYCGGAQACSLSYSSDQIAALEYVYSISDQYDIAAVNLSLGAGAYEGYCDLSEVGRKAAIDNLRSVGIATVIASGNDGNSSAMQAPACISSAISVGASTDADSVASFSNVAEFLSLLAPGVSVTSSAPGGGTDTLAGTSMAAPHVAGAWAVLRQRDPNATVEDILVLLQSTGVQVENGSRNGSANAWRRVDLEGALGLAQEPPLATIPGVFTPMPGCRIVDTRGSRSSLEPLLEYSFLVGKNGQNLSAQGGAGGSCGLPKDVAAVEAAFTIVTETSSGYLRTWRSGNAEPTATLLSWYGNSATNSAVVPVCISGDCGADFVVKLYGNWSTVDLVIDVFGYYSH